LLVGCGGSTASDAGHAAEESLDTYARARVSKFAHKSAEAIDGAREQFGDPGKELVCFIVQHSQYNETTWTYTLPSQGDVENQVAQTAFGHSLTKEAIDDVLGTLQDAGSGQIVKASADAGCFGKFLTDSS
jgi:hypothetical protein